MSTKTNWDPLDRHTERCISEHGDRFGSSKQKQQTWCVNEHKKIGTLQVDTDIQKQIGPLQIANRCGTLVSADRI